MPIEIYDKTINEADTRPVAVKEPVKIVVTKAEEPQKRASEKWTTPGAFKSEHR